jgi:hypothetical protein
MNGLSTDKPCIRMIGGAAFDHPSGPDPRAVNFPNGQNSFLQRLKEALSRK